MMGAQWVWRSYGCLRAFCCSVDLFVDVAVWATGRVYSCRWGMERLFTHALAPGTPPPAVATAAAARMASWLGIRLTSCSQKV